MTLRTIGALAAKGLVQPSENLEKVAAKYAVAITPAMADLIGTRTEHQGIQLQFVPTYLEL